jgi:hypothetical protein
MHFIDSMFLINRSEFLEENVVEMFHHCDVHLSSYFFYVKCQVLSGKIIMC